MSNNEPDYKDNLAFEKDITLDTLIEVLGKSLCVTYEENCVGFEMIDRAIFHVYEDLELTIDKEITLGKFVSLNAIKKVIEAIMEGVE